MNLHEKTVTTKKIFEGKVITLRYDTVLLPNGEEAGREIVEHPGGVAIVALDDEENVYLVRQYRHPFEKILLEIPAGKLNYGEDPFSCGVRELKEETGLSAKQFDFLGSFMVSPGFCGEKIYIYLARGLSAGNMNLDPDEFLEVEKKPLADLLNLIMANEIEDAKTVIGILKVNEYIKWER
ncbi:MAG: NUDIX hydrolase [Ruminococcaceae bacterium]|nr:NUDIX hydrolase [Oscillospiraceae bacterium]